MIEEYATVVATDKDNAVIEVTKTSSCGSCQAKGTCGTASLANFFNFQAPRLTVENSLNAKPGDQVLVGIKENTLVTGSLLLYIVPILSMLLFAIAAGFIVQEKALSIDLELSQTISGLVGLAVGLVAVRYISATVFKNRNKAILVKIISHSSQLVSVTDIRS